MPKKTTFINSFEIINWNIDKHYLKDLQKNGINIAPTVFIKQKETTTLKELFQQTNWNEAVIKPTISGAAKNTYRINASNLLKYEDIFQKLIQKEDIIFQEFLYEIRNMTFEQYKEKYFKNEHGAHELWVILKKCCDLNVQRNNLIDEIDEKLVEMVKASNEDLDNAGFVQKSHKTY